MMCQRFLGADGYTIIPKGQEKTRRYWWISPYEPIGNLLLLVVEGVRAQMAVMEY